MGKDKKQNEGRKPRGSIPYGRARASTNGEGVSSNTLGIFARDGEVYQPEQSSSSVVDGATFASTPNGTKTNPTLIHTEGGREYVRRSNSMIINGEVLFLFSPVRSKEAMKEILGSEADPKKSHHAGGKSELMRAKVGPSSQEISNYGIDPELLQKGVDQLNSSSIEATEEVTLNPKQKRVKRTLTTLTVMKERSRDQFKKLLEQVKTLEIDPNAKEALTKYLKLNIEKLQVEWAHMLANSHSTSLSRSMDKKNLAAGTERLNTQMLVSEMAASSLALENYSVEVQTKFNKFTNTEVLNMVEHIVKVTSKDQARTITLVNTIANIAAPEWKDLPKDTDPSVIASIVKAILERKPWRAIIKPGL